MLMSYRSQSDGTEHSRPSHDHSTGDIEMQLQHDEHTITESMA